MIALHPLGDRAFLAEFASEAEACGWAAAVRARAWQGVLDVVLANHTAAVFADPDQIDLLALESQLRRLQPGLGERPGGKRIEIPVLYDGPDLAKVASRLQLSPEQVVAEHTSCDYTVFAIGFQPGFPYAGYLPESLRGLARRESPRVRVPAGSVAVVGKQTAVYPAVSPGGWHLIGRTPLVIVDVERGHFPIEAGDQIRFVPIGAGEFADREGEAL